MEGNMKERIKITQNKAIALFLAFLMVTQLFVNTRTEKVKAATNYGKITNLTNKTVLDDGSKDLCLRTMTNTLDLTWPETFSYVDVVFVQDASGSFTGTIDEVKKAIKNIASQLQLENDSKGYPKDRVMITSFQNLNYDTNETGYFGTYEQAIIHSSPLLTDKSTFDKYVDDIKVWGGTPTPAGMIKAQEDYKNNTPSYNPYNNATYTDLNGNTVNRRTVYILVTDGAANANYGYKTSQKVDGYYVQDTRNTTDLVYYKENIAKSIEILQKYYWPPYLTITKTDIN